MHGAADRKNDRTSVCVVDRCDGVHREEFLQRFLSAMKKQGDETDDEADTKLHKAVLYGEYRISVSDTSSYCTLYSICAAWAEY